MKLIIDQPQLTVHGMKIESLVNLLQHWAIGGPETYAVINGENRCLDIYQKKNAVEGIYIGQILFDN
jgi:hypothetical protein